MIQEAPGSLPPREGINSGPVWEGEVLEQGVKTILELAVATKARAVFVRGYETWQITPINTATAEIDTKWRPSKILEVHLLTGGSSFNRRGQKRFTEIMAAEDAWTSSHPEGPGFDLNIHFAKDHFAKGERIDWNRFAHDYGLNSDDHLKIWPQKPTQPPQ